MKKFFLLLNLRFKANKTLKKNPEKLGLPKKNISRYTSVLIILISLSPMIILSWMGMSKIYPVMNQLTIGNNTLADAMLSNYIMLGAIMFIVGFFPLIVYEIISNDEEIQFLLTLPVSRTTIFFVILTQMLMYSIYPLLILIPSIYSYTLTLHNNFFSYFNSTVILIDTVMASLGISGAIALTIARGMKRKTSKKLLMIVSLVNILILISFIQLMPTSASSEATQSFANLVKKLKVVSLNNYNPFYWSVQAIKGDWLYLIMFTVFSIALFYILFKLSSNLEFEGTSRVKARSTSFNYRSSSKSVFLTVLIKDLKLLFREDQTLFMLIYPIGLPLLFSFMGSFRGFGAIYFAVILSSQYCAMSTYASFGYEKQISPYQLTFPIKKSSMLISKTLAPTLLYSLVIIIVDLIFVFGFKSEPLLLILIPYTIVIIFELSVWSAKLASKNINSFNTYKEAMRSGQFKITMASMLLSQEVMVPFIFVFYPKLLGNFSWLQPFMYFIPIILMIITAFPLFKNIDNVYEKLQDA